MVTGKAVTSIPQKNWNRPFCRTQAIQSNYFHAGNSCLLNYGDLCGKAHYCHWQPRFLMLQLIYNPQALGLCPKTNAHYSPMHHCFSVQWALSPSLSLPSSSTLYCIPWSLFCLSKGKCLLKQSYSRIWCRNTLLMLVQADPESVLGIKLLVPLTTLLTSSSTD